MKRKYLLLLAFALLSACNKSTQTAADKPLNAEVKTNPVSQQLPVESWVGEWFGVEGLYLKVEKDEMAGPGNYILTMQTGPDDSSREILSGVAIDNGIRFTRSDGVHMLRLGNGDDTGLKWLADKTTCLFVAPGEGYCRD